MHCFSLLFGGSLSALCSLHVERAVAGEPRPPSETNLSLGEVTRLALAENPSLRAARANWEAMKARIPQAAAWEDLSVSFQARVGRFVDVPANAFTDNMLMVEQKVPLNGKNLSRARAASAEAAATWARTSSSARRVCS